MSNNDANKKSFVSRNTAAAAVGSTMNSWHQFLLTQGNKGDGSITDLEKRWLRVKGGTGESLYELWNTYLNSKGYTGGSLADRKRRFFQTGTQA